MMFFHVFNHVQPQLTGIHWHSSCDRSPSQAEFLDEGGRGGFLEAIAGVGEGQSAADCLVGRSNSGLERFKSVETPKDLWPYCLLLVCWCLYVVGILLVLVWELPDVVPYDVQTIGRAVRRRASRTLRSRAWRIRRESRKTRHRSLGMPCWFIARCEGSMHAEHSEGSQKKH